MTKSIWTGVFAAIVGFTTTVSLAQTPAPQGNAPSADQITVAGCLKEAPATPADATVGTAGAPGAAGATGTAGGAAAAGADAAAAQKFVLTDAAPSPAAPGPAATPGAPAAAAASGSAQTYKLVANPAALSPHVGKKLELTGTIEAQTAGAEPNASVLRVTSGKIVAESCSAQ